VLLDERARLTGQELSLQPVVEVQAQLGLGAGRESVLEPIEPSVVLFQPASGISAILEPDTLGTGLGRSFIC
jgi:hypothetical protein